MKFEELYAEACDMMVVHCDSMLVQETVNTKKMNEFGRKMEKIGDELSSYKDRINKAKNEGDIVEIKKIKKTIDSSINELKKMIDSMDEGDLFIEEPEDTKTEKKKKMNKKVFNIIKNTCYVAGAVLFSIGAYKDNEVLGIGGLASLGAGFLMSTKKFMDNIKEITDEENFEQFRSTLKDLISNLVKASNDLDKYLRMVESSMNTKDIKESVDNVKLTVYESERSGDITAEQRELLLEMLSTIEE